MVRDVILFSYCFHFHDGHSKMIKKLRILGQGSVFVSFFTK